MLPTPLRHLPLQGFLRMPLQGFLSTLAIFHSSSTFFSSAALLPFVDLHLSQWPRHRVGTFSQAGSLKDEPSRYTSAQLLLDMGLEAAELIFSSC